MIRNVCKVHNIRNIVGVLKTAVRHSNFSDLRICSVRLVGRVECDGPVDNGRCVNDSSIAFTHP